MTCVSYVVSPFFSVAFSSYQFDGIGVGAQHLVVQHLRSVDRLVPVPAQVLAGNFVDRVHEIFLRGMGEAVPHEVGVQGVAECLLADDGFQRNQHGRRLAVGDVAVGAHAHVGVTGPRERIDVRRAQIVLPAADSRVAHLSAQQVDDAGVCAVHAVQHLHFGVAVDAFIQPAILEFVGRYHSVPVLVAEFMLGDADRSGESPLGMNQPLSPVMNVGILHAAGFAGAMRRIDHRELRVRIRPVPLVKALHAAL